MKGLGCLLLLVCCTMSGLYAAAQLRRRVRHLERLKLLLDQMGTTLRFTRPTIADLLAMLAEQPCFAELRFLQDAVARDIPFPDGWETAIAEDMSLSEEERDLLSTVGQTLGSTDLDGQLSALSLCSARLDSLRNDAQAAAQSRCRLYPGMGVLGGIFLVILLL